MNATNVTKIIPKWEYKQIELPSNNSYLDELNKEGKDGWELVQLVSVFNEIYGIFKRLAIKEN